jgi:hypothetical protein
MKISFPEFVPTPNAAVINQSVDCDEVQWVEGLVTFDSLESCTIQAVNIQDRMSVYSGSLEMFKNHLTAVLESELVIGIEYQCLIEGYFQENGNVDELKITALTVLEADITLDELYPSQTYDPLVDSFFSNEVVEGAEVEQSQSIMA